MNGRCLCVWNLGPRKAYKCLSLIMGGLLIKWVGGCYIFLQRDFMWGRCFFLARDLAGY